MTPPTSPMPSPSPSSPSSAPDLAQLERTDSNGSDTLTGQGTISQVGNSNGSMAQETNLTYNDDRPVSSRRSKDSSHEHQPVPRLTKTPSTPVSKSKLSPEKQIWSDKEYFTSEAHLRPERSPVWPPYASEATAGNSPSSTPVIAGSLLGFDSQDESFSDSDFLDGSMDEPDTGEHFKQATSEFFSKMGYWLYNSKVGQYISKDDRVRTKTVFTTDAIWVLGICYSFDGTERVCSLPGAPRSRKSSLLHNSGHTSASSSTMGQKLDSPGEHTTTPGNTLELHSRRGRRVSLLPTWVAVDPEENTSHSANTKALDVQQHRSTSHERGLEKKRHKELIKEKKVAKAREREIERNLEKERIRRQKDLEKLEKFKSKISRPRLQQDINRTDLKDLPVLQSDNGEPTDQNDLHFDTVHKARSVHGYNPFLGDSGDAMDADNEATRNVVRKMKSISILDRLSKKSPQESSSKTLPERTHQSRSRSISSISVFYQRSPTSSSVSGHNDDQSLGIAGTSYPSSKSSMSFNEILAEGPRNSVLSKITTFNNNQRKLPELPSMDDLPDIPTYQYQTDNAGGSTSSKLVALQKHSSAEPTNIDYARLNPQNTKSGRRRMTVSGQYSPDNTPSAFSNDKTVRPTATILADYSTPESITNSIQQLSARTIDDSHALAKNRSNSEKHLRQRRSFYNSPHNQAFTAETDEPVPLLPRNITPSSPIQSWKEEPEKSRKSLKCRTSILPHPSPSTSSTGSSPKSNLRSEDLDSNGLKISHLTNSQYTSQYPSDLISPPLLPESPSEPYVMLEKQESWVMASRDAELFDLPPTPVTRSGPEMIELPFSEQKDPSGAIEGVAATLNGDGINNMDTRNRRLNNKKEAVPSEIQSDWEAINPSNKYNESGVCDGVDFLHVQDEGVSKISSSGLIHRRRGRMSNLAGSFVKVRAVPGVVSPQPKVASSIQNKMPADNETNAKPSAPNDLVAGTITDGKPLSARQRLLNIPSTLLTSIPKQGSPTSPNPSVVRSLKALSPRPLSPKHTPSFRSSVFQGNLSSTHVHPAGHDDDLERYFYAGQSSPMTSEGSPASPGFDPSVKRALYSGGDSPTVSDTPIGMLSRNQITLTEFMLDFRSRMWFTYRKDIARIEPSYYTSDAGWGCMMRTAQSLLAQGFIQTVLGREWRADSRQPTTAVQKYTDILGWFADEPDRLYSIHNLARSGLQLDKRIGEWFGPSTVAHSLKRLSQRHSDCPVVIHVPMDNSIRMSEIARIAVLQPNSSMTSLKEMEESLKLETTSQPWKPVVLLIPARYGIDKLTEKYTYNLKHLFTLPQFLGIAGGRPGRSLYFVACQGNELFYLDPHVVKPKATSQELKMYPANTYHCRVVRSMDILELDPSMLLGLLIKSYEDLVDLWSRLNRETERAYPLITLIADIPVPKASPEVAVVGNSFKSEYPSPQVNEDVRIGTSSFPI